MKGDFTRDTFRNNKHYRKVNMQQGRVQIDADWNEQNEIQFHFEKEYLKDLIGKNGTLAKDNGFAISASGDGFLIGKGHYYVDGILAENESDVEYTKQPDVKQHSILGAKPYLVYLDVWERHITSLDDPYIREQALLNVDTATRAQIVWQVLTLDASELGSDRCKIWENALKKINPLVKDLNDPEKAGTLKARAKPSPESTDRCSLYETAGYTRLENQLYRIEVHNGGNLETATFKWSRENGTVVSRITKYESNSTLAIEKRGKDDQLDFKKDDWIEITDDLNELHGIPGTLVQLDKIEDTTITYDPTTIPPGSKPIDEANYPQSRNPKIRRWEPVRYKTPTGSIYYKPLIDSTIEKDSDGYIELEDGVQIMLGDSNYRTGDCWLVPARTREGKVEWPTDSNGMPDAVESLQRHHYAPLALLEYKDEETEDEKFEVREDFRSFFSSLTELIMIHYAGGDGQQALPDNRLPAPLRVSVTLGDRPISKTPLRGAKVKFTIDKQSQSSPGSLRALPEGAPSSEPINIPTKPDNGIAECQWTLGDNMEQQQVRAELYDDCGNMMPIQPIYFDATLQLSFYYISGDGVEAKASEPILLSTGIMLGKQPISDGYKVQFEVVEGGSLQLVGGGPTGPTVTVDPDTSGTARANYLHSNENPRKQVRAILYKNGDVVNLPPIYFNVAAFQDLTAIDKFIECKPDFILTNGMAYNYLPSIGSSPTLLLNSSAVLFRVKPGELTRWHIVNAGPRKQLFFQFPNVPIEGEGGDYKTISTLPPLSTSTIEVTFPRTGVYPEMDADLCHFMKGSGFVVVSVPDSAEDDHPKRSKVVELPPRPVGEIIIKELFLTAERKKVPVVPDNALLPGGYNYNAIVLFGYLSSDPDRVPLNDSIPGPVVAVNVGDTLIVTIENKTNKIISLSFPGVAYTTPNIQPGGTAAIKLFCKNPGLFLYHGAGDALNGIWEHVWNGMYGGIIVRPPNERRAKEFCVIFSELYSNDIKALFPYKPE